MTPYEDPSIMVSLRLSSVESISNDKGFESQTILDRRKHDITIEKGFVDWQKLSLPELSRVNRRYATNRHEFKPIKARYLEDALIFDNGLIAVGDTIVSETVPAWLRKQGGTFGVLSHDGEGSWRIMGNGEPERKSGTHYAFSRYAFHYYGHFLIEILPRILLADRFDLLPHSGILLDKTLRNGSRPGLTAIAETVLHQLLGNDAKWGLIPEAGLRIERLLFIDPLGGVGRFHPEISPILQDFADDLCGKPGPHGTSRRLFLSRKQTGNRLVSNEKRVASVLDAHGFEMIDPLGMDLCEQISLFRSAQVITGPLGSAFSNMVFSPQGLHVVGLIPEKWTDIFFSSLTCICGQIWHELRCDVVSDDMKWYQRNSIRVDTDQLDFILSRYVN